MYCTPEAKFFAGDVTSELARGDEVWDTWWGDELVFNTACLWTSRTTGGAQDAGETTYDCVYD